MREHLRFFSWLHLFLPSCPCLCSMCFLKIFFHRVFSTGLLRTNFQMEDITSNYWNKIQTLSLFVGSTNFIPKFRIFSFIFKCINERSNACLNPSPFCLFKFQPAQPTSLRRFVPRRAPQKTLRFPKKIIVDSTTVSYFCWSGHSGSLRLPEPFWFHLKCPLLIRRPPTSHPPTSRRRITRMTPMTTTSPSVSLRCICAVNKNPAFQAARNSKSPIKMKTRKFHRDLQSSIHIFLNLVFLDV